ncbi:hypothetical protein ACFPRL_25260 [Pseudoclavibacter helvolus]
MRRRLREPGPGEAQPRTSQSRAQLRSRHRSADNLSSLRQQQRVRNITAKWRQGVVHGSF